MYVYEGGFINNLKHGKGKIIFQTGDEFDGYFFHGKF
jgi:hypothetical protein